MPAQSMTLYLNPADVIERMQLQSSLAGVTEVVTSAIIGAQLHVQSAIGSRLEPHTHNSLFYLDDDAFSGIQPGGLFRLEMPSGFIRMDMPITINFGSDWLLSDVQSAILGSYTIDFERGYILMSAKLYACKYVQVICTTGFLTNAPTPALPTVPSPSITTTPAPYSPLVTYNPGDTVYVQTPVTNTVYTYVCLAQTLGNTPPNSLYWQQVVQVPVTPTAFSSGTQYAVNNVVTYTPPAGVPTTFICTATPPVGTLPTVTTYWAQVVYEPEQIPQDLYEGIMSDIPNLLNADETTNRSDQAEKMYKALSDHANMLLKRYFRLKGFSFRPIV